MPSSKDLLEAAAFRRRRLAGALLTGTPHGETVRVARPVVVGALLAGVAVGAARVAAYLGAG